MKKSQHLYYCQRARSFLLRVSHSHAQATPLEKLGKKNWKNTTTPLRMCLPVFFPRLFQSLLRQLCGLLLVSPSLGTFPVLRGYLELELLVDLFGEVSHRLLFSDVRLCVELFTVQLDEEQNPKCDE